MATKKTTKTNKFDYDDEQQSIFHAGISSIIHYSETPSDVLDGVAEYIKNSEIETQKAVEMLLISTTLVIHQTLAMIHNELGSINNKNESFHFSLIDAFVSQLATLMWSYSFRNISFDKNASNHKDSRFIQFISENHKTVFMMIAKWIAVWLYIATFPTLTIKQLIPIIFNVFDGIECSVELIIMSYFYALHDFIAVRRVALDSFYGLAKLEQVLKDPSEINKEQSSFEFDGKTFKITNQSKH